MHPSRPSLPARVSRPLVAGVAGAVVATSLMALGLSAASATPTPDLLDVVQANGTTSAATAISLLPVLSNGVSGTTINLPTAASGANHQITMSGSASSEGALALSADGRFLTMAGYNAAVGTPSIASTASGTTQRVVARIDGAGHIDTSTTLNNAFTQNNVRGAATNDGSGFWVTGAGGTTDATTPTKTGLVYVPLGGTAGVPLVTSISAGRTPQVVNGQVYLGTDKTTPQGVSKVGTGLPTAGTQTLGLLNGPKDPYGYALLSSTGGAPDTLYVADGGSGSTGGINKFSLVAGTWVAKGTIAAGTGFQGLTGKYESDGVHLYATTIDGTKLDQVVDSSGQAGTATGTVSQLLAAPGGTFLRGVAFAPSGQIPPGPRPVFTLAANELEGVVSDPSNPTDSGVLTDSDSSVDVNSLTPVITSSNPAVAPLSGITLTGTPSGETISVTPASVGYSTITISFTDGLNRTGSASLLYGASAAAPDATSHYLAGASDASSAEAVGSTNGVPYVIVADDLSNQLRLYRADQSGAPVKTWNFDPQLGLSDKSGDSMDLEASARIGNTIYWSGSMGNGSSDGALDPARNTLFATTVTGTGANTELTFAGSYNRLRSDMLTWDHANGDVLGLTASAAAGHTPKAIDGFNIEGLEFANDGSGTAYLGFRAPYEPTTNRTQALVLPVTNYTHLLDGTASTATFGTPMFWNLGGLGIRELRRNASGQYLVMAGAFAEGSDFELYSWDGNPADQPVHLPTTIPAVTPGTGWESIVSAPDPLTSGASFQILEDDGDANFYNDSPVIESKDQDFPLQKSRIDTATLVLVPQTISFTSNPGTEHYGDTYVVSATGGASGQPVVLSIPASSASVCSLGSDGVSVTFTAVGTCVIDADQAGATGYDPAQTATQSVSVGQALQVISFTQPGDTTYGGPDVPLTASSDSGLPVTFTSTTPTVCTVVGQAAHPVTAGMCSITASQAGNANYAAAMPMSRTLLVAQAAQTISFTQPGDTVYGGPDVPLSASATSGLPVTFTSTTPAVCSVVGQAAHPVGAGTCSITATQAGNANYLAAPSMTRTLTVAKAPIVVSTKSTTGLASLLTLRVVYTTTVKSAVTGLPVAGVPVSTRVNGGSPTSGCTATTNANGVATCTAGPIEIAIGVSYTATAAETANFLGGTGTAFIGLF